MSYLSPLGGKEAQLLDQAVGFLQTCACGQVEALSISKQSSLGSFLLAEGGAPAPRHHVDKEHLTA